MFLFVLFISPSLSSTVMTRNYEVSVEFGGGEAPEDTRSVEFPAGVRAPGSDDSLYDEIYGQVPATEKSVETQTWRPRPTQRPVSSPWTSTLRPTRQPTPTRLPTRQSTSRSPGPPTPPRQHVSSRQPAPARTITFNCYGYRLECLIVSGTEYPYHCRMIQGQGSAQRETSGGASNVGSVGARGFGGSVGARQPLTPGVGSGGGSVRKPLSPGGSIRRIATRRIFSRIIPKLSRF